MPVVSIETLLCMQHILMSHCTYDCCYAFRNCSDVSFLPYNHLYTWHFKTLASLLSVRFMLISRHNAAPSALYTVVNVLMFALLNLNARISCSFILLIASVSCRVVEMKAGKAWQNIVLKIYQIFWRLRVLTMFQHFCPVLFVLFQPMPGLW